MTFRVELSPLARKRLARLPRPVQQLILKHLVALEENPRGPGTQALSGDLSGLWKLRVGDDYRAVYEVDAAKGVVRVATIGHRRMVYKEMRRQRH